MMDDFVTFELPDGRLAYVRRDAVTVVFDQLPQSAPAPYPFVGDPLPPSSVVHTNTTAMPVPYTAAQVMDILYGTRG